ncbi:MAG: Fur family transcriptional regulator [Gammaproteobacteria bacterium]
MNLGQNNREAADIAVFIKQHGINPTAQRIEIAKILLSRSQHLSADQVLNAVNRKQTIVSKATVYNTLNLFAEKGLVRQVIVDPNKLFYDSNTAAHFHIYNEDSGQLIDLDAAKLEISGLPKLPENTVECGVDVIVRVRNRHS